MKDNNNKQQQEYQIKIIQKIQNMNNYFANQNNNNNNILLRGNMQQISLNHIKQLYLQIEQCIKSQQLHAAINIQNSQYRQIISTMGQRAKIDNSLLFDEEFNREVHERCLKIKKDNDSIMIMSFNFKELMAKVYGGSLEVDINRQNQFIQIQQKIKKTKLEIVNKLQMIRTSRNTKKNKNKSTLNQLPKRQTMPVMKLALTQLKDSVQIVNSQLIKQKQEIKMLVKYLYQADV